MTRISRFEDLFEREGKNSCACSFKVFRAQFHEMITKGGLTNSLTDHISGRMNRMVYGGHSNEDLKKYQSDNMGTAGKSFQVGEILDKQEQIFSS